MQIDQWEVSHPDRLVHGIETQPIHLPEECRLLFVATHIPCGDEAQFLAKVLQSFGVSLAQARFITPNALLRVAEVSIEWLWLAGVDDELLTAAKARWADKKFLTSLPLEQINGNNQQRRALWQQIKSYE